MQLNRDDPFSWDLSDARGSQHCVWCIVFICVDTGSSLLLRVSGLGEQGLLFVMVCGFLAAGASLVAEHRLQMLRFQTLQPVGPGVCRLSSNGSWA